MKFFLVSSPKQKGDDTVSHTLVYRISEHWLSKCGLLFTYLPSSGSLIGGAKPWNWGIIAFKNRMFPDVTWGELHVHEFLNDEPSKISLQLFLSTLI